MSTTSTAASSLSYSRYAAGVRVLAPALDLEVEELLRARPVSGHWRRLLLGRLDAVAVIYRLAATVSSIAQPLRFRWYRASPLDAALVLPDGRTIGIVRQGLASERTAFGKLPTPERLYSTLRSGTAPT